VVLRFVLRLKIANMMNTKDHKSTVDKPPGGRMRGTEIGERRGRRSDRIVCWLMSLNDRRGAEATFHLSLRHWFKQGHCRQLTCIKISDYYRGRACLFLEGRVYD
jgi:hypothetical protein